uniref:MOSC_N domain-containing protein n=1 Tax=Ascaris lumbricoides TaxID=6252 RepID=A0A0M3II68_ASCLU
LLKRTLLLLLYVFGIFICVPLSLFVWWVRRKFFNEKSVVGDKKVLTVSADFALFSYPFCSMQHKWGRLHKCTARVEGYRQSNRTDGVYES